MSSAIEAPNPVGEIVLRAWQPTDRIGELTALLHAAYARLGAMGLNYTAVDQTEAVTAARIGRGECYVGVQDGRLVGTITLYPPDRAAGCPWYDRPDVAAIGQFAVHPACQQSGLGSRLMEMAEARAKALDAAEIALDTAEPARHLVSWYAGKGYRLVEHTQWEGKVYRSVIMSKSLG